MPNMTTNPAITYSNWIDIFHHLKINLWTKKKPKKKQFNYKAFPAPTLSIKSVIFLSHVQDINIPKRKKNSETQPKLLKN